MRKPVRRPFFSIFLRKGRYSQSIAGRMVLPALIFLSGLALQVTNLPAQVPVLITQAVDTGQVTVLENHHPLWANAENDQGALPAGTEMVPLTLVLQRGPAQEQALEQLIADLHNPASAAFRQWLTPAEVGERFGLSDDDLSVLTGWLESQGLHVDWVSPSRIFIGFSGTAGAVGQAFGTEVHAYRVNGERRISVASDPTVPQALKPAIAAVRGLFTIEERPLNHRTPPQLSAPQMTVTNGSTTAYYIAPADFNTIYDVPAGLTGAGETIGIVSESRTDFADFTNFKSLTGVTFSNPTEVVPTAYGGVDPGAAYTTEPPTGDSISAQVEATLDVTRAGSVAPGASLLLVVASEASGGIAPDTQYLVETTPLPANIISISFGECESSAGSSVVTFWNSLFEQAASEGISVLVSSGDSGASGCDTAFATPPSSPAANSPNSICSSSYATCVGGTEFNDTSDPSEYWHSADGTGLLSAIGYIPEGGWNEPGTAGNTQVAASGGGVSAYVPTPSWQTGTGVPSARTGRYTPDVSFSASCHDSYFGCMAAAGGSCVAGSDGSYYFVGYCGTSASAPGMAGVTALLNQKLGAAQGSLNAQIYAESASTSAAFHDVTVASSGVTSCSASTPSMCNNSIAGPSALTGGQAGYLVTTGYDEVTGLGSLNVSEFLDNFIARLTPTVTVTPSASSITTAQSLTVTVAVSGGSGNPTPTGTVTLTSGSYTSAAATLASGSASITVPAGSLSTGTDTLTATYTPDSSSPTYNSATGTHSITVTAGKATPTVTVSPSAAQITTSESLTVTVTVTGAATPTGSVTLVSGSYTSAATTLASGAATISIPAGSLATGTDTLTVTYTPDSTSSPTYNSATGTGSVKVTAKQTPTVTVSPSPSTINTSQSTTVTITVAATAGFGTPTGSVTLTSGSYTSAAATLAGGSASITIPAGSLATGSDTLTASYTPDSTSSPIYDTASGTHSITVSAAKITPTVTVTPSASQVTTAEALTVTVSVSGGTGTSTATGSVTLTSGSYSSAVATLSGGSASISIPAGSLATGVDTLTSSYTPDSSSSTVYNSATGTGSVTVTAKQTPTVTVTPSPASITTTETTTVTIAVGASGGYATPTGSVKLTSGSYASAATTLSGGSASITIPAESLAAGSDTLTVTYTPDSTSSPIYNSATATHSITVTAAKITPTVAVSSSAASIAAAQSLSVTITLSGGGTNPTPTGSVTLSCGSYTSSATTLSAGAATIVVPAGSLATGSDTLTASYAPDSSSSSTYNSATGTATVTVSSLASPPVTLTPSASSITPAQTLQVNIVVSAVGSDGTPTGSVTLKSGSYASVVTTLASGHASITVPAGTLPAGSNTLTATYTPDSNSSSIYTTSSGTARVTVAGTAQTGFTLTSANVTLEPGATTGNTSVITVTPVGGFTGSVTLTAEITASPAEAVNPPALSFGASSPVVISSAGASTATLTIATTAPATSALTLPSMPAGRWYAAGGTAMACLLFFCAPVRRRAWRRFFGIVVLTLFGGLAISCSSGGSGTGISPPPSKVTPTVTVTPASSGITTSQTLTVNIAVSGGASNPTPTGTVTLTSGGYASATTTLSGGQASITIPAGSLASGTDTLSATYTPDASSSSTYNGASGSGTVVVSEPSGTGTTPGSYTVTVTGTWGATTETTSFILTVQ
jgi:subtilase family serine protease